MKISVEEENRKITFELPDDLNFDELMEEIQGLVAAMGYNFSTIEDYWNDFAFPREGWIFEYENALKEGDITVEEILTRENFRRNRAIKMSTVLRAVNAAGFSQHWSK